MYCILHTVMYVIHFLSFPFCFLIPVIAFSFVVQSHNPFSTVREALRFSGRLRLPRKTNDAYIESHVDYVLDLLDIAHLQDEIIGTYYPSSLHVHVLPPFIFTSIYPCRHTTHPSYQL
jgi:hypothetical protein